MTLLREVIWDIEATFSLRENPHPSNFITKAALRAYELRPAGGPQAVIVAHPFVSIPPPSEGAVLGIATNPLGHLRAVDQS